jgi:predicted MFS family arabinose efflux permease
MARAFIGFGVSACLMAAFKAYTLWFDKQRWPLVNGFQMAAGGLGALAATAPVAAALQVTDWRGVFLALSILTLLVAVIVFLIVPEKPARQSVGSFKDQLQGVKTVFTSLDFWRVAPLTTLSQASFLSIQGLWVGPWLKDVAGLDRATVAGVLLWVAVAMVAGFILLGSLAGRLSRSGISVLTTAVVGMGLFMVVLLLVLVFPDIPALPLWMIYGFLGTSGILSYAALSLQFPVRLVGRVNTAVNLLVFIAAFAAQWGIGAIIELWPVGIDGRYAVAGYRAGFGVMLGLQAVSLLWFFVASQMVRKRGSH